MPFRMNEQILTIHETLIESDAFEWEYYYDAETKILIEEEHAIKNKRSQNITR